MRLGGISVASDFWKPSTVLLAAMLATGFAATTAAQAGNPSTQTASPRPGWAWCWGTRDSSYNVYVYGPVQVDLSKGMILHGDPTVKAAIGDTTPKCHIKPSKSESEDHIRVAFTPETTVHRVGAGSAAVPAKPVQAFGSAAGSLTIKDNGIAARLEAWDNVLLQAQREEATRKAVVAAATAESKAKYKQIMNKAIAEAKKRGNKQ